MNNKILKHKYLYKFTSIIIKYLPSLLALWQIIMLFLNYSGLSVPILGFLGGSSLMFLGLLFLLSYLFQYCSLYRIPLGYNLIINIIVLFRSYGIIPVELIYLYRIFTIITGVFILLFIYFAYKYRNNPKIGGIKAFCDKYLDCKF